MKITIELDPKLDDSHVLLIYRLIAVCELACNEDKEWSVYAEDLTESLILLRDACRDYVSVATNDDPEYFDKHFGAENYKAKFAKQFLTLDK